MKLKCIIIDDDIKSVDNLRTYIEALNRLDLVNVYLDPVQALTEIPTAKDVDLIFMDVDMPLITGIELSKALKHKTKQIVFTTSHAKYALNAFEVHATGYLLKPFSFVRFVEVMNHLFPLQEMQQSAPSTHQEDYFFVRDKQDQNNLVKIRFSDIILVESISNYVRIVRAAETTVAYISLFEMETLLKGNNNFIRVHRSFIISKENIVKVEGNMIWLSNHKEITIGRSYRESVSLFLKEKTVRTGRT